MSRAISRHWNASSRSSASSPSASSSSSSSSPHSSPSTAASPAALAPAAPDDAAAFASPSRGSLLPNGSLACWALRSSARPYSRYAGAHLMCWSWCAETLEAKRLGRRRRLRRLLPRRRRCGAGAGGALLLDDPRKELDRRVELARVQGRLRLRRELLC